MTADARQSALDEQLAAEAQDRTKLLAQLAREAAKPGVKSAKYVVYRQSNHLPDVPVHGHRFEWVAQLCAHRRERQHGHEAGGHYTVRRADA